MSGVCGTSHRQRQSSRFRLRRSGASHAHAFPKVSNNTPIQVCPCGVTKPRSQAGPHGRTKHISEQAQWACPKSRPVPRVAQDHRRSGMSLWWVLHLVVCVQAWRRCSRAREASPPHVGCHSPKEPGARARGLDATQMVSGTPCVLSNGFGDALRDLNVPDIPGW